MNSLQEVIYMDGCLPIMKFEWSGGHDQTYKLFRTWREIQREGKDRLTWRKSRKEKKLIKQEFEIKMDNLDSNKENWLRPVLEVAWVSLHSAHEAN